MKRLDPAFDERGLGFSSFSAFLQHFPDLVFTVDPQHIAFVIIDEQNAVVSLEPSEIMPEETDNNENQPIPVLEVETQIPMDGENDEAPA